MESLVRLEDVANKIKIPSRERYLDITAQDFVFIKGRKKNGFKP
jgi:hypothetical protein